MSTFSHTLRPESARRLSLVPSDASAAEEFPVRNERGLGAMRGLALALACDIILAAIAIAGWQLWRLLR